MKRGPTSTRAAAPYGDSSADAAGASAAKMRAAVSVLLTLLAAGVVTPEVLRQSVFAFVAELGSRSAEALLLFDYPLLHRLVAAVLLVVGAVLVDAVMIRRAIVSLRSGWVGDVLLALLSTTLSLAAAVAAGLVRLEAAAQWVAAAAAIYGLLAMERALRANRASHLEPRNGDAISRVELNAARTEKRWRLLLVALSVATGVAVFFVSSSLALALGAAAAAFASASVTLLLPIESLLSSVVERAKSSSVRVRSRRALEGISEAKEILFDDTAVLERAPRITDYVLLHGTPHQDLLGVAASALAGNEDLVARSIIARAGNAVDTKRAVDRRTTPGGAEAIVAGKRTVVARHDLMPREIDTALLREDAERFASDGKRVVVVARDGKAIGAIALIDDVIRDAPAAITELRNAGLRTSVLLEESESAAAFRTAQLNVDALVSGHDKTARDRALARVREGASIIVADPTAGDLFASSPLTVCIGGESETAVVVERRALDPLAGLLLDGRRALGRSNRRLVRDSLVRAALAILFAASSIVAGAGAAALAALASLLVTLRLERPE